MEYDDYLARLVAENRFGTGDRLGTANLVDAAARRRAAASVETGECLALARPLVDETLEVFVTEGDTGFASDRFELRCHGLVNTHLDALNHISIGGTFYGGRPAGDPDLSSMDDLARHGLFTRGVLVDVPAARGTDWASAAEPVGGDDIDRALGDTTFEPGDALLLYLGRDRFDAAGETVGMPKPGVGRSGAEWIADHGVSMVCWDFLDTSHPDEPPLCVHRLIRAIGLLLVDNCDLSSAAAATRADGRRAGALAIAPIAIPGGTGCAVTPLLIR
ncbi:MAG: cyclase family protein [Acidimicrobiia bacterium]